MKKRRRMTVEEFLDQPEIQRLYAKKAAESAKAEEEHERLEEPLTRELAKLGYKVRSAWELDWDEKPYPKAFPVLLEHLLKSSYPDSIRGGIAGAFRRPEALEYWDQLAKLYRNKKTKGYQLKNGLANALVDMADNSKLPEIISMYSDRTLGETRGIFIAYLSKSRDPRALQAIEDSLSDPELAEEAKRRLRAKKRRKSASKK